MLHSRLFPCSRLPGAVSIRSALVGALLLLTLPALAAAQNGTITGTVTSAGTGAPLVGGTVWSCSTTGCIQGTLTNASGDYSLSAPAGTYYLLTDGFQSQGFVNEIFDNIPCPAVCDFNFQLANPGTPVVVTSGGVVAGRNFALAQGASIAGTATNAVTGAPIQGKSVQLIARIGNQSFAAGSVSTNSAGAFTLPGLPPGNYFAYTTGTAGGYVNEIYDNIPCVGSCSSGTAVNTGTPIVVTGATPVTGRNFALDPGGSVSGTVTDSGTGAPVQNVLVTLRSLVGTQNLFAGSASTNASGVFTVSGLAAGTYFAYTSAGNAGYTSEIFDNILCPGSCSSTVAVNSGAPIAVTAGVTTSNVSFALDRGARITGTIVNQTTSAPLQGVSVQAYIRIGLTATFAGSASTNASGGYSIGGLPAGTYALFTSTNLAINEIYNNLPCLGSCSSTTALATGEPVAVARGGTASGKDFQLDPGGAVSGTITDALSAAPLASVSVALYRQSGTSALFMASGFTNTSGVYTAGGLPTGTYFAVAFPPSTHVVEAFGGQQCILSCPAAEILAGTPIAVTAGATTTGRDFVLEAGGTITGTVTNAATAAPLANATVLIPIASNSFFGFNTNAAGVYTISGLPAGTHRVSTSLGQYANEVYDNVTCPAGFCSSTFMTTNGSPIGVTGGAITAGINFALDPLQAAPGSPSSLTATVTGGTALITWSPPTSGGVATSYILEAGVSPGTTAVTLPTTAPSLSVPGVPAGTFYLRVRAVNAFGAGPASAEFVLTVGSGGAVTLSPPTNLVAWTSDGRLTMTWTAPTGTTPTSYVVEAGSAVGLSNIAVLEVTNRSFTFEPVPGGFYFLRVRSKSGALVGAPTADVMINVGGVPAPPSQPQSFGVSRSGSTITMTWTAPLLGTATSYVVEAGSATGLSNLAVLNTGSAATTLVVPGVPPGTYFLRVRAANAFGASPVSIERSITVP